jgi:hypothetical protein
VLKLPKLNIIKEAKLLVLKLPKLNIIKQSNHHVTVKVKALETMEESTRDSLDKDATLETLAPLNAVEMLELEDAMETLEPPDAMETLKLDLIVKLEIKDMDAETTKAVLLSTKTFIQVSNNVHF